MKVNTTRFGELQVNKEDIITFSEGVLGFEKFFLTFPLTIVSYGINE